MRRGILLGVLGVILIAGLASFHVLTDRPSFCRSCHFMVPFVENWETSTHKDVNCKDCHWSPGLSAYLVGKLKLGAEMLRYAVGAQNPLVRSQIRDGACLKCHPVSSLPDTVWYQERIPFQHRIHYGQSIRGIRTTCTTCHYQLVQGNHLLVAQEACIQCHFVGRPEGQPVQDCYTCHGPPRDAIQVGGFTFSHSKYLKAGVECTSCHIHVTKGRGDVRRTACKACHVQEFETFGDSLAIHEIHVTQRHYKCEDCHEHIQHRKVEISQAIAPECQTCHPPGHSTQEMMYLGTGGKGVSPMPDPMFLSRVACFGCHTGGIALRDSQIPGRRWRPRASGKTCEACHGKGYARLMNQWQRTVTQTLTRLEDRVPWLEPLARQGKEFRKSLEDVEGNLLFVRQDGSFGAHNIRYTVALLKWSEAALKEIEKAFLEGRPIRSPTVHIEEADTSCERCHACVAELTVEVDSLQFPHGPHTQNFTCSTCHSTQKHGLTLQRDCNTCHHEKYAKNKECSDCHKIQSRFYHGTLAGLDQPDVMADAEVACEDCHGSDHGPVRPTSEVCVDCHDETYAETLQEWQEEFREEMASLEEVLTPQIAEQLQKLPRKAFLRVYREVLKAKALFDTLQQDGSQGVHNPELIQELVSRIRSRLMENPMGTDSP